jgi:hypothetical protein
MSDKKSVMTIEEVRNILSKLPWGLSELIIAERRGCDEECEGYGVKCHNCSGEENQYIED